MFSLFRDSLDLGGILCLGSKESLSYSEVAASFEALPDVVSVYRLGNHHAGP